MRAARACGRDAKRAQAARAAPRSSTGRARAAAGRGRAAARERRDVRRQRADQGARRARGDRRGGDRRRLGDRGARARRPPRRALGALRRARTRPTRRTCEAALASSSDARRPLGRLRLRDRPRRRRRRRARCRGPLRGHAYRRAARHAAASATTRRSSPPTPAPTTGGRWPSSSRPRSTRSATAAARAALAEARLEGGDVIRTKSGAAGALDRLELAADRAQAGRRRDHRLDRDHHRGGPLARSTCSPR